MTTRRSAAAITKSARSVQTCLLAKRQSEQAISESRKLLSLAVYPAGHRPPPEQ